MILLVRQNWVKFFAAIGIGTCIAYALQGVTWVVWRLAVGC